MSTSANLGDADFSCLFPHCGCTNPARYSSETYVGNWYEETVQNTLKREEFLRKRECEDLSIQRSQIMVDTLLKPVELTAKADGYLHYGDSVQIVAPGPDCSTAVKAYPFRKLCKLNHLALSGSVGTNEMDLKPWLDTDSIITASPHLFPCVRNSYVIEHPECPTNTSTINYGDCFRIRTMPTQQFALYLHSAPAIKFHASAVHSAKPLVRFSDTKNPNTLWTAHPLDPKQHLRMPLGIHIPLKTRLVIKHTISGKNLSLESTYPTLTYFGCECEVSVESKRDTVRRISWENHWVFDTDRGWPKDDRAFVAKSKFAAEVNADDVNKSASDEARKEEEERLEKEGWEQEEMTPEECEQMIKEEEQKRQDWDAMIRKAVEDHCMPRQKKEANRYPELRPPEPPVCLNDISELQRPWAVRKAECDLAQAQKEEKQMLEELRKKRYEDTAIPGYLTPHDPMSSPQPHSHQYTLSDTQSFYPNRQWGCGDTKCCYRREPNKSCVPSCNPGPECAEPTEPRRRQV